MDMHASLSMVTFMVMYPCVQGLGVWCITSGPPHTSRIPPPHSLLPRYVHSLVYWIFTAHSCNQASFNCSLLFYNCKAYAHILLIVVGLLFRTQKACHCTQCKTRAFNKISFCHNSLNTFPEAVSLGFWAWPWVTLAIEIHITHATIYSIPTDC